jgi:hypothetical protein
VAYQTITGERIIVDVLPRLLKGEGGKMSTP